MGLFGKKKIQNQEEQTKKAMASNVKYIYDICEIIADTTKFILEMAEIDEEHFSKYAEEAMGIMNEATDITGKAISASKNYSLAKAAPLIETYKSRINQLQDDTKEVLNKSKEWSE